jgi:hypothetical protein
MRTWRSPQTQRPKPGSIKAYDQGLNLLHDFAREFLGEHLPVSTQR